MSVARTVCVCVGAIVATVERASLAFAQADQESKERCAQLIDYYDYYGAGRSENSDGARNMTRIGAYIDCQRGRYESGIRAMETLLREKKFTVAAAKRQPSEVGRP